MQVRRTKWVGAVAAGAVMVGGCSMADMRASKGDSNAQFMATAAHSSHSEIAASQIALQRASDPRVKQYAQMMINDHRQQNEQLMALARQEGASVPKRSDEMHAKVAAHLRQLSGRQFDQEYMSEMVADHAMLLSKVEDKAVTSPDPQVRQFAAQQIPVLRSHLDQAREINRSLGGGSDLSSSGGTGAGMAGVPTERCGERTVTVRDER